MWGESEIRAGERTYRLRFGMNALCALQEAFSEQKASAILKRASTKSMTLSDIRAFFWACLREHHAEVDLKGAGNIIDEAGGRGPAIDAMRQAMESGMPTAKPGQEKPDPNAQRASGASTTSSGTRRKRG